MAKRLLIALWLVSTIIFSSSALGDTVSTLLEEGIYAEETKGDLDEAMMIYQKIIDENAGNSANIAEAYYRLGACYLKTGDETKAIEMFKALMTGFREHREIASNAGFQLAKLNALEEEDQTVTPLELGPVPWKSGETCWYNFGTPVIENLGKMIWSIKDVAINGNDLWRIETYVIIPGQSQFSRVDVLKKGFKPFSGLAKGVLNNKVKYEKDHIQMVIDNPGTKETKKIPINNIVYDGNQVDLLLRRLQLNEGYSNSLSIFNLATGNITKAELRNTGIETVKAPAGTFECYCVELVMDSKMKAKLWISTDEKRYLVKYDLGAQGVMELERIEQVSAGEPELFNDIESGISMSAPEGWHIVKNSITAGSEILVDIQSPELKADSSYFFVHKHFGAFKTPQDYPEASMGVLKQTFKNYTLRPESWVYGEIDGLPSSTFIADYNKEDKKMVEYRTDILGKQEGYVFILRLEKETFDELKADFESIVQSFKWNKIYDDPATTVLKKYRSPDYNFELDIPEQWYSMPPDNNNSPSEVIRFGSHKVGPSPHKLIVFRFSRSPYQTLEQVRDNTQNILSNLGYRNFAKAETTIGSKDVLTLDYDIPAGALTVSSRQYFIPDGDLIYDLGFDTIDKAGMMDLYDRVAKTFRTE